MHGSGCTEGKSQIQPSIIPVNHLPSSCFRTHTAALRVQQIQALPNCLPSIWYASVWSHWGVHVRSQTQALPNHLPSSCKHVSGCTEGTCNITEIISLILCDCICLQAWNNCVAGQQVPHPTVHLPLSHCACPLVLLCTSPRPTVHVPLSYKHTCVQQTLRFIPSEV